MCTSFSTIFYPMVSASSDDICLYQKSHQTNCLNFLTQCSNNFLFVSFTLRQCGQLTDSQIPSTAGCVAFPCVGSSLCLCSCPVAKPGLTLATPWTVSRQAPLSLGFSRQEYRSGWSFPPPGGLPDPGIESESPVSPALAGGFFTTEPPGKP